MNCALCQAAGCVPAAAVKNRQFFRCPVCGLLFVPPEYHLSPEEERARYELHDNSADNQGYVRFLTQVADIAERCCPPGARMFDFGCGRNAVLAGILRSRKRRCDTFDPLYDFPPVPVSPEYGLVIMCEVIEHCRDLRATIGLVGALCRADAPVIIRTRCYPDNVDLAGWWYAQDTTHINLFSRKALEVAAMLLRRSCIKTEVEDIYLLR